jgi:anaerobic magnesium-protoporphyrin IX monomethyl ester cyclase
MKILLVQPGQKLALQGNNPAVIEKERGKNPPLGLLYVASTIEQTGRHQLKVLDLNIPDFDLTFFKNYVQQEKFDILGITLTTFTLLDALEVIAVFREFNPGGLVIAGGPHVAIFPKETMALGVVDVAVKREGEPVINDILERLGDPAALAGVPGICYRMNGDIYDSGEAPYIDALDALPPPNRALLPYRSYFSLLGGDAYSTTIFTSRGCPFHCAFCDRPALGKKFRCHGPDYVINEIRQCLNLGIREFLFYDDTFTVNRARVLDICRQIVKLGLDIRWDIRARVDTVDEEILKALKKAGCVAVHYGVESGSERILKRLNKGISLARVREVFELTRKVGLETLAYFMLGNPGETRVDIDRSLALAMEIQPDMLHLSIFTPFPATRLYQEALESGLIGKDVWLRFAQHPTQDFEPPIWEEHFTRRELQELITKSYKSFYLRPEYVWRRLHRVRTFSELKRKFKAGLSVLKM